MFNSVEQQLARAELQDREFAHAHHSDVCDQSGSMTRTARSTVYEPNLIQNESGATFLSVTDGDDEDTMTVESSQLEHVPPSLSLVDHVL